ncbi:hypothetical protein RB195_019403 [Necator americanus]|uniref:UVR domain-containing protein n=1 Tax=Necator americanus TaxID=51031 RepID=A0ABR1CGK6_NECAM
MATTLNFRTEVNGNILDPETLSRKPWISQRDEKFPIKIRLVLRRRSIVERIQIVAHNKFIPQQVVVSTMENEARGNVKEIGVLHFKADLDTQYELKTIYTEMVCTSIILCIERVHINDVFNPSQQVGLVEVQVFGQYDLNAEQHALFRQDENVATTNTVEDGRFSAEIGEIIERIEKNKQKSVSNENFGLASIAQLSSRLLQKAKGEMVELEKDQRDAIRDEDFHRALDLQEEMKTLRKNALATVDPTLAKNNIDSMSDITDILRPKNLFEKDGHDYKIPAPKLFTPIDLSPSEDLKPLKTPPRISSAASAATQGSLNKKATRKSSSPNISLRTDSASSSGELSKSSQKERPTSASSRVSASSLKTETSSKERIPPPPDPNRWHSNKFLQKENTVVPALRERKHHNSNSDEERRNEQSEMDPSQLVPIMEKATYLRGCDLFGENTMGKLYSKKWEQRNQGLSNIQETLEGVPLGDAQAGNYLDCAISILQRRLKDPLYNAYISALDLLSFICTDFLPRHSLYKLAPTIARATSDIIALRASDTDRRSAGKTLSTINDIMEQDTKAAKFFLNRFLKMGAPGGQRGQANIQKLISLTEESVTSFGLDCLKHTDTEIRSIGRKLILEVYTNGKRDIVRKMIIEESRRNKHPAVRSTLSELANLDAKQDRDLISSTQSGSSKKRPGTKSVRISNELPKRNGSIQSMCRFCGKTIDSYEPSALERHYNADCPMFTKCSGCGQIVEVSSLGIHKTTNCRAKENYRSCPRCGELIERRLFHRHVGKKDCKPPDIYSAKCPLCGLNVSPDNTDGWRRHLTGALATETTFLSSS